MTDEAKDPKAGYQTTEFWMGGTIGASLIQIASSEDAPESLRIVAIAGCAVIAAAYAWARTKAKA